MNIIASDIKGNQERYVHAERFTQETYPIPVTYRLKGPLDNSRLAEVIDRIVENTPVLMTRFATSEKGIAAHYAATRPRLEVEELPAGMTEDEIYALVQTTVFQKPEDLTAHEMVRLKLYRIGPDDALLLLSLHHAVSDGMSMGLLAQQIEAGYNGQDIDAGRDFYAVTADQDPSEASRSYWNEHLAGQEQPPKMPEDIALSREASDPRPVIVPLDRAHLERVAQAWNVTQFSAFATLSQAVFARAVGAEKMALSFQSAGRRSIPNSARSIGPFSNALILTAALAPDTPLAVLASEQQRRIREAVRHEDYPYQSVVRDTGLQPSFGINWFPAAAPIHLTGLAPAHRTLVDTRTNYDIDFPSSRVRPRWSWSPITDPTCSAGPVSNM
ncbi:condensation domain-containing protein [Pseudorhodobacter turbinis]|uniref:condensation domain-containing protein n=1 Tax=Pseudorhodobacter turbinis TaxID=2500533 RepID=UPI00143DF5DF|nr:condensation domain-containing protein [Pseudorhodobacter turbinis]